MQIITKKPYANNLKYQNISLNSDDLSTLLDHTTESCIEIYTQDEQLLFTIPQEEFHHLTITPKFGEFGEHYFVANFSNTEFITHNVIEPIVTETAEVQNNKPVQVVGPITVTGKRSSSGDPKYSITYRTKEILDQVPFIFEDGKSYIAEYSTGDIIKFKASRGGKTLYSGSIPKKPLIKTPSITGQECSHTITALYTVL